MPTFGFADQGFSYQHDEHNRVIEVRAWGMWEDPIAASFKDQIPAACVRLRMRSAELGVLLDLHEFKVQRIAGQEALGSVLGAFAGMSLPYHAVVLSSSLVKMQVARLARESGATALKYFGTREEAIASVGKPTLQEKTR